MAFGNWQGNVNVVMKGKNMERDSTLTGLMPLIAVETTTMRFIPRNRPCFWKKTMTTSWCLQCGRPMDKVDAFKNLRYCNGCWVDHSRKGHPGGGPIMSPSALCQHCQRLMPPAHVRKGRRVCSSCYFHGVDDGDGDSGLESIVISSITRNASARLQQRSLILTAEQVRIHAIK